MDTNRKLVAALLDAATAINGGAEPWESIRLLGERLRSLRPAQDAAQPAPAAKTTETTGIVLAAQDGALERDDEAARRAAHRAATREAVDAVFRYWQSKTGHAGARLTNDRITKIQARLREGYTVPDLLSAIDGNVASPYHSGENDRQTKYDSIDFIFRNGSQVERFRDMAPRGVTHDANPVVPKQRTIEEVERDQEIRALEAKATRLLKEKRMEEYADVVRSIREAKTRG